MCSTLQPCQACMCSLTTELNNGKSLNGKRTTQSDLEILTAITPWNINAVIFFILLKYFFIARIKFDTNATDVSRFYIYVTINTNPTTIQRRKYFDNTKLNWFCSQHNKSVLINRRTKLRHMWCVILKACIFSQINFPRTKDRSFSTLHKLLQKTW